MLDPDSDGIARPTRAPDVPMADRALPEERAARPQGAASGALAIEEVADPTALEALAAEWTLLFEAAPDATPFQSWQWIGTWWRHHGRGRLFVLLARAGASLVAILPLTISRYRGTPLRQVRFAGAPLSDLQQLIALRDWEDLAAEAFLAHLAARRSEWDLCDLNDQPDESALARALPPGGLRIAIEPHRRCAWLALPSSYDGLLARLGTHMRSNLKRRRKKIAAAFARVEIATADGASLVPAMEELFALHNRRWRRRGAPGAFAGGRMQRFHHEVARRFLAQGWLRLYLLRLDGRAGGACYCFQHRGRVYHYLGGIDLDVGSFAPGIVLLAHAIERAISEGATCFDMLRGDEPYKHHWRPADRVTRRVLIGHATLRSRLALAMHRIERALERRGLAWQRRLWGEPTLRARATRLAKDLARTLQERLAALRRDLFGP